MRVKLQGEKFMEGLSLGTTYTVFRRVESENIWSLVEEIPMDYHHVWLHMPNRKSEEERLKGLSN